MPSFDLENFKTVNMILERDSMDATYKYALIRGAVEIFQHADHYRKETVDGVSYPLGLLIERWLLYYYPIFESGIFIPQMGADTRYHQNRQSEKPKFRVTFDPIINYYRKNGGGFSQLYSDYQNGRIPDGLRRDFLALFARIQTTIVDMPMVHLGYSLHHKHNEIFRAKKARPSRTLKAPIDPGFLIEHYGEFTIGREYYTALKNAGPFLIGDNSLLFRWAQFSERRIDDERIRFGDILRTIADYPVEERDIGESLHFYDHLKAQHIPLHSVWSGRKISGDERTLDHLIPFSVWKNNDIWNILPATRAENAQKSDRIPDPAFLISRKDCILGYWSQMMEYNPTLFTRQIRFALVGSGYDPACWQDQAFESLVGKCRHMVKVLGYVGWKG